MSYLEIVSRLRELGITPAILVGYWNWDETDLFESEEDFNAVMQKEFGEVIQEAHYGGQGKGDTWWTVMNFKNHDVMIKVEGFYSSYGGVDFNGYDFEQVRPMTKTIIVYS